MQRARYFSVATVSCLLALLWGRKSAGAPAPPPAAYVAGNATVTSLRPLARVRWNQPSFPPVTLEDCASACASAYSSCALFHYLLYTCPVLHCGVGSGGLCELFTRGAAINATKDDPSNQYPGLSWAGYVEGRAEPPQTEGEEAQLSFDQVSTFHFMPTPLPPSSEPDASWDISVDNCTADRYNDRLTLSNCARCGWKAIQDWQQAQYLPWILTATGGPSGWHDSVWGCFEPEEGFYAPYGLPIPADQCKDVPTAGFSPCTCKEGLVYAPQRILENTWLDALYEQDGPTAPHLDPCIDSQQEWGCSAGLFLNATAGCAECPHGSVPVPTLAYGRDPAPDMSHKCASCTNSTSPVALHCADAASCHQGEVPWGATTQMQGGPYCSACPPEFVLPLRAPGLEGDPYGGQYLGCVPCTALGCAEGACDAAAGCTACASKGVSRTVFQKDANRTMWMCTRPSTYNWPTGPHGS